MSKTCTTLDNEFCSAEEESSTTNQEPQEEGYFSGFISDFINSPEGKFVVGIVGVGAAVVYKAYTGNDVCIAGVCTHSDHDHGDCDHHH